MIVTQYGRTADASGSQLNLEAILNKYECKAIMDLEGQFFKNKILLDLRATMNNPPLDQHSPIEGIWERDDPHYHGSLRFTNAVEQTVGSYMKAVVRRAQTHEAFEMTAEELRSKRSGYFSSRSISTNLGGMLDRIFTPVPKEDRLRALLQFMQDLHLQKAKILRDGGYILPAWLTDSGNPEFVSYIWEE